MPLLMKDALVYEGRDVSGKQCEVPMRRRNNKHNVTQHTTDVCVYIYIYIYIHTHNSLSLYIYIYMYMCVYIYVYVYIRIAVIIIVISSSIISVCVYIYIYIRTHKQHKRQVSVCPYVQNIHVNKTNA